MKLSELGEIGLVDRLSRLVAGQPAMGRGQLLLGPGDDTSAWLEEGQVWLATTDSQVEGVHFLPGLASWRDVGWRALAVNLSDIAGMGGVPSYALVSLGLPADRTVEEVEDLYAGLLDAAQAHDCAVAGGDVHLAPVVVVTVALFGRPAAPSQGAGDWLESLLLRSQARPGDAIAVTGHLGSSAAGFRLLRDRLAVEPWMEHPLREAHLRPQPRIAEGIQLARAGVRAGMDVSDGLLLDLGRLCRASGVSATVRFDLVPVHPAIRSIFPDDWLDLALGGGEDYELLVAGPSELLARARSMLPTPLHIIGELSDGPPGLINVVDAQGNELVGPRRGWEHLTSNE